jgi:hypothetical protein
MRLALEGQESAVSCPDVDIRTWFVRMPLFHLCGLCDSFGFRAEGDPAGALFPIH